MYVKRKLPTISKPTIVTGLMLIGTAYHFIQGDLVGGIIDLTITISILFLQRPS